MVMIGEISPLKSDSCFQFVCFSNNSWLQLRRCCCRCCCCRCHSCYCCCLLLLLFLFVLLLLLLLMSLLLLLLMLMLSLMLLLSSAASCPATFFFTTTSASVMAAMIFFFFMMIYANKCLCDYAGFLKQAQQPGTARTNKPPKKNANPTSPKRLIVKVCIPQSTSQIE